jgi:hypothetical protein
MMQRGREREWLRERRAWLVGVTVREYREMEAGERVTDEETWRRICDVLGLSLSFTR